MKKILVLKSFDKSVKRHQRERVAKLLDKLQNYVSHSTNNRMVVGGDRTKKISEIFKLRATYSDRIFFTYPDMIKNLRNPEDYSICLIRYVDEHDKQGDISRRLDSAVYDGEDESFEEEDFDVKDLEVDDSHYREYDDFLDVEKNIAYVVDEEELGLIYKSDDGYKNPYISDNQFDIVFDNSIRFLSGGAGTGKTLVCLHKLAAYNVKNEKKAYFTYSDGLKERAKELYGKMIDDKCDEAFFTIREYCELYCDIDSKQFMDLQEFVKEYDFIKQNVKLPDHIGAVDVWSEIRGIIKGFMGQDWSRVYSDGCMLSLESYLSLDNEKSIYNESERRLIYDVCERYERHLSNLNYYDDNDLARLVLKQLGKKGNISLFDYIVVDEVQDLTEVQIYLLYQLVKEKDNIILAGDIHQIINPTYFGQGRIGELFNANYYNFEEAYLSKNYRSKKKIVDVANKFCEIRRDKIASRNQESEQDEFATSDGGCVFSLKSDVENLKSMVIAMNKRHDTVTLVANESEKDKLKKLIQSEQSDFDDENCNIYTISEIKGLEYSYVFLYNLVGKYNEYWDDIYDGKAKKDAKYRYYFNIVYVGLTRGIDSVCFYDEIVNEKLRSDIGDFVEDVFEFDEENLNINLQESSNEEWRERALQFERSDDYDNAIKYYKRANSELDIVRCEARKLARYKKYDEAVRLLIDIGELKVAQRYINKVKDEEVKVLFRLLNDKENLDKIEEDYGNDKIAKVIVDNVKYVDSINTNYVENLIVEVLEDIESIEKSIDEMWCDCFE